MQATYVLMDRDATIDRVDGADRGGGRAGRAARGVPGGLRSRARRSGSTRDRSGTATTTGSRMLVENAVVVPSPATDRLAAIAAQHSVWLVVGVQERDPTGSTIYNTVLYFSPTGRLVDRHRKLVPTGSERTVWGMGDGSTLRVVETPARPDRRADLLGELHAAGPVPPLRAGRGRVARADAGPGRRLDRARCGTSRGRTGCTSSG